MNRKHNTKLIFLISLLGMLPNCSFFDGLSEQIIPPPNAQPPSEPIPPTQPKETEDTTTKVGVDNLAERKAGTLSDVEVLWQIPTMPVEGFIINYGFEKHSLDQHVKVATADLEKFEDQKFGFVFRYVLGDIPLNKTVYVSIAAYNGSKVSKPSNVFPISAENPLPSK